MCLEIGDFQKHGVPFRFPCHSESREHLRQPEKQSRPYFFLSHHKRDARQPQTNDKGLMKKEKMEETSKMHAFPFGFPFKNHERGGAAATNNAHTEVSRAAWLQRWGFLFKDKSAWESTTLAPTMAAEALESLGRLFV